MRFRIFFLLVTLFFLAMNAMLWRSEFSRHSRVCSPVPPPVVGHKILTAPDNSRLAVDLRDKRIGYFTWAPNINAALATGKTLDEQLPPEGMVERLTGYTLDVDGSVSLDDRTRLRLNVHLQFSTNHVLEAVVASLKIRPDTWEIHSVLARQTLQLEHVVDDKRTSQVYELSNPRHLERLLGQLGLPLPPGTLSGLGAPDAGARFIPASLGLDWDTCNDWLQIGNARFRVYRLQASLLGRYEARVFISPIGEILRVELPGNLILRNDALIGLQ